MSMCLIVILSVFMFECLVSQLVSLKRKRNRSVMCKGYPFPLSLSIYISLDLLSVCLCLSLHVLCSTFVSTKMNTKINQRKKDKPLKRLILSLGQITRTHHSETLYTLLWHRERDHQKSIKRKWNEMKRNDEINRSRISKWFPKHVQRRMELMCFGFDACERASDDDDEDDDDDG